MSVFGRSFPRYPQNLAGLSSGQFNQTVTSSGNVIATLINVTVQKIVDGFETIMGALTITGNQTINGNLFVSGNLQADNNLFSPIPAGVIIPYSGDPSTINFNDWLLCDGQNYAINNYPNLYNAIGDKYNNASSQLGTFNVPDFRGRVGVGVNGTLGTLGTLGGSSIHLLTNAEMPAHIHTGSTNISGSHRHNRFNVSSTSDISGTHQHGPFTATVSGTHNHNINYGTTSVVTSTAAGPTSNVDTIISINTNADISTVPSIQTWNGATTGTGTHQHTVNLTGNTDTDGAHIHSILLGISGNNNAHTNLQPYLIVNFFIKT